MIHVRPGLVLVAAVFLAMVTDQRSADACDSTCCLMLTRGTAGLIGRGGFQVELSYRYTSMSARRVGSEPAEQVIRPKVLLETGELVPGYHEELAGADSIFQVDVAWGVGGSTTAFASLPVAGRRDYQIAHGGFQTSYIVHGMGDLVVGARQALVRTPRRALAASLGVKLPTGTNDRLDSYDATIMDPTLQPGTGSGDVMAALQWSTVGPGRSEVAISGSFQLNTTNEYRYRFANQALAAVTAGRPIGRLTPSVQVKVVTQGRSELGGKDVPSTGGTIVNLNTGLRFRSPDGLSLYAFFLVPVYRRVNDAQLAPRFSLVLGFAKAF